uniref:Acyl carrier protein n=1 Tax=Fundidesulfovibrio putealis TaxID=270496 RepID=A0A7C3WJN8_9BACT
MQDFPIEELYRIMSEVFMQYDFAFRPDMGAKDVPGWDSLNHSVLMMDIGNATGVDLSPEETAKLPSIGALHALILERMAQLG